MGGDGGLKDRWAELQPRQRTGALLIGAAVVAAAVVWYVRSMPSTVTVSASGPMPGIGAAASPTPGSPSATPSASQGIVVVDVTGWVRQPGVYDFSQGDRVVDAIRKAGGAKPGADLTSINLAAVLTDAEQIVVGREHGAGGLVSAVGTGGAAGTGTATTGGGASGASGGLVNVNTGTLDELETLPGIGPALGQRIIDYRTQHGPFHSVQDLLNVSGIGDSRLADIKSKVTV